MTKIGLTSDQVVELKKSEHETNKFILNSKSSRDIVLDAFNKAWGRLLVNTLLVQTIILALDQIIPSDLIHMYLITFANFTVIIVVFGMLVWRKYYENINKKEIINILKNIEVKVYRDGRLLKTNIDDLVLGDCIDLEPGDKIPADGILLEGTIEVKQYILSGEEDNGKSFLGNDGIVRAFGDNKNFKCFCGTTVVYGTAIMKITKTGKNTSLGEFLQKNDEREDFSYESVMDFTKCFIAAILFICIVEIFII